jgi:Tol biopolymer transport system component
VTTRPTRRVGVGLGVAAAIAMAIVLLVDTSSPPAVGAQLFGITTTTVPQSTTSFDATSEITPGRIAYVTPTGEVVIAKSDGSSPQVIGEGAEQVQSGLAPLAWSPDGVRIAYIRNDGAVVLASTDFSSPPEVVATDAILTPFATEDVLSFLVTGQAVAYPRRAPGGRSVASVAYFDGPDKGRIIDMTDPNTRIPTAFQFSPIDPYLYLQSVDLETLKNFTTAVIDPLGGQLRSSPYSLNDPVLAPDGAYLYGVVQVGDRQQLIRIDSVTLDLTPLRDQDRICKPMPSPDGKRIVYAAGPNCGQVWTIGSDGSAPKELAANVGSSSSFAAGAFSWSLDGSVISHASCRGLQVGAACGGAYWDIPVNGRGIRARALATSVRREFRPLLKPIKAAIDIKGPVEYSAKMLLSSDVAAPALEVHPSGALALGVAADKNDPSRSLTIKFLQNTNARFLMGTIQVIDPKQKMNRTFTILGSIVVQSYRYASLRGIWLSTTSMPLQSGQIDLTLYR